MSRFVHEVHMRWSDMDAFGHVNNSAYFVYLEQARVALFFVRHDSFEAGTVISHHEIDYLGSVSYHPEPLRLELWVDRVRGASFVVHYEVFDAERLVARAQSVCVPFDFGAGRPRRLTDEERAVLAGYADDAGPSTRADAEPGAKAGPDAGADAVPLGSDRAGAPVVAARAGEFADRGR